MNEVYRRSCGIDIHKDTVVVCILPPVGKSGEVCRKTYRTFRNDLIRLRVWLKQLKVTEIAMESTGVYWRPVRLGSATGGDENGFEWRDSGNSRG